MSTADRDARQLVLGASLVGANRGGRHHIRALAELAAETQATRFLVRTIDAVAERADVAARLVEAWGGEAVAVHARLEEVLPELAKSTEPLVAAIDSPKDSATALRAPETNTRWVFPYSLLRLPGGTLLSLRGAIPPGDSVWRHQTVALLESLAPVTAERGAAFVIGARATSAARIGEARHRAGMAEHLKSRLRKIVAGLAPEGAPLTISSDGLSEHPLLVAASATWQDSLALGSRVLAQAPIVIPRGSAFAVGEVNPAGLRLHFFTQRTDGTGLLVRGRHALDTAALRQAAAAHAERERRARLTLSRLNPVDITD